MTIDLEDILTFLLVAIILAIPASIYLLIGASLADLLDVDGALYWLLTLAWPIAIGFVMWLGSIIVMAVVGIVAGSVAAVVAIVVAISAAIRGQS